MTFKENKPIYLQIADRIMDEILQEVYEEEGRILYENMQESWR